MQFRYRFVDYGTRFVRGHGERSESGLMASEKAQPQWLLENELALDVGASAWGHEGEELPIIDHHFRRKSEGFPSAAAGVLHNAARIAQHFCRFKLVWLVTHRQPDFDALCAAYLARCLITTAAAEPGASDLPHFLPSVGWDQLGMHPDGWFNVSKEIPKFEWFNPMSRALSPDHRWAVLLASLASHVDNGRHLSCPREKALPSVLYAAFVRGRNFQSQTDGATELFDAARRSIVHGGRNPLFDSLLDGDTTFAPELELLARQSEAYERDIRRARKAVVFLATYEGDFDASYDQACKMPLLTQSGERAVLPGHWENQRQQADGIFLRDPECLLFKEWARVDTENSPGHSGFLFTALANSRGRTDNPLNPTDYYFSLDPERAGRSHLYDVWTRLQSAEARSFIHPTTQAARSARDRSERGYRQREKDIQDWDALAAAHSQALPGSTTVVDRPAPWTRAGFAERAGSHPAYFNDPWFDGLNYKCTIIPTPNQGTFIAPPGTRADLDDDPVVAIVCATLEDSLYRERFTPVDLPDVTSKRAESFTSRAPDSGHPSDMRTYRFAKVSLAPGVSLESRALAEQIGRRLWRVLQPEAVPGWPTDFIERHLLIHPNWVGVWSRRGFVIAFRDEGSAAVERFERSFRGLVALAEQVVEFMAATDPEGQNDQIPEDQIQKTGDALTRMAARLRLELAAPDARILSRFFEASNLSGVLETVRDLTQAAASRRLGGRIEAAATEVAATQSKLEWVEVFVISVYAVELLHAVGESFAFPSTYVGISLIVIACIVASSVVLMLNLPIGSAHNHEDLKGGSVAGHPKPRAGTPAVIQGGRMSRFIAGCRARLLNRVVLLLATLFAAFIAFLVIGFAMRDAHPLTPGHSRVLPESVTPIPPSGQKTLPPPHRGELFVKTQIGSGGMLTL